MAAEVSSLMAEMIEFINGSETYIGVAAADIEELEEELDQGGVIFVHGIDGAESLAGIPEAVIRHDRRELSEEVWLADQLTEITARRAQQLTILGRFAASQTDLSIDYFATARKTYPWTYVPKNTQYLFREFVIIGDKTSPILSTRRTLINVVPHLREAGSKQTSNQFTTYMGGITREHFLNNLYPN